MRSESIPVGIRSKQRIPLKREGIFLPLKIERRRLEFVLAIFHNKPSQNLVVENNNHILPLISLQVSKAVLWTRLGKSCLRACSFISGQLGIGQGLARQGWPGLAQFSSVPCALILLDWASYQGYDRAPKKKVETHKCFFKPSQKKVSQQNPGSEWEDTEQRVWKREAINLGH